MTSVVLLLIAFLATSAEVQLKPDATGVVVVSGLSRTSACVYWTQGLDSRATLEAAGMKQICVAPEQADAWRAAGFTVTAMTEAEFAAREALPAPGVTARPGVASPTRAPWIIANGWRFLRSPDTKYAYTVPAGKAALAAAEAFAYGGNVAMKIEPADAGSLGAMLTFFDALPTVDLPPVADFAVVDDGAADTGEVMNLLSRRNLLFEIVRAPAPRFQINVALGSPAYPRAEAADPSAFALKIRRQLTDEARTLRLYGSEVVICRLLSDSARARLHLVNYAGRDIEGLRVRLRGSYREGEAHVAGTGRVALADQVSADGATEFSLPKLGTYAVVDLRR
jgi:hypothetical protein